MSDSLVEETCEVCGRTIVPCVECAGTGVFDGDVCEVCNGAMIGCPIHNDEYRKH